MSGHPEGIANGPSKSEHLEKDAQIWERPWTLEEMRQSSANWSLAADSGVSQKTASQALKQAKKTLIRHNLFPAGQSVVEAV